MGETPQPVGPQGEAEAPLVAVVMGSTSDWETMRHAAGVLKEFGVAHECRVVSAHRTPEWMAEFAAGAESRGLEVIIAGAGGAAHLPGMVAAQTLVPVLGVRHRAGRGDQRGAARRRHPLEHAARFARASQRVPPRADAQGA
jgi:NCAIR mutase (PurE)-related protein